MQKAKHTSHFVQKKEGSRSPAIGCWGTFIQHTAFEPSDGSTKGYDLKTVQRFFTAGSLPSSAKKPLDEWLFFTRPALKKRWKDRDTYICSKHRHNEYRHLKTKQERASERLPKLHLPLRSCFTISVQSCFSSRLSCFSSSLSCFSGWFWCWTSLLNSRQWSRSLSGNLTPSTS